MRLISASELLVQDGFSDIADYSISKALGKIGEGISDINRYVEHRAPWRAAKEGRPAEVGTVLYHAAETLRLVSILLWPVMPERMTELWRRFGWEAPPDLAEVLTWGRLAPGTSVVALSLFYDYVSS